MESCGHLKLEPHVLRRSKCEKQHESCFLSSLTSFLGEPSICLWCEGSQGQMRACLFRRLDRGFRGVRSRFQDICCYSVFLAVRCLETVHRLKLWKTGIRCNPPMAYLSVCYYDHFSGKQKRETTDCRSKRGRSLKTATSVSIETGI